MKISADKRDALIAKGYKGEDTLEALVKEVSKDYPKFIGGTRTPTNIWWVVLKDAEKNKTFEDVVVDKYIKGKK